MQNLVDDLKTAFDSDYAEGDGDSYHATETVIDGFRYKCDLDHIILRKREYLINNEDKVALLGMLCCFPENLKLVPLEDKENVVGNDQPEYITKRLRGRIVKVKNVNLLRDSNGRFVKRVHEFDLVGRCTTVPQIHKAITMFFNHRDGKYRDFTLMVSMGNYNCFSQFFFFFFLPEFFFSIFQLNCPIY